MSFLSRIWQKEHHTVPVVSPNDDHLTAQLEEAKRDNVAAVTSLVKTAKKQESDVEFARQVINDVLVRADKMKARRQNETD